MASQLNSDNLKERRIGLADSFDILSAHQADPGLGRLLPERIFIIEVAEGGRAQRVLESSWCRSARSVS